MTLEYSIIIKGGDKAFSVFNNLNKINDISEKVNKIYEKMGNTTLSKVNKSLKETKKVTSSIGDTFSSIGQIITGNYSGALEKIKGTTKNSLTGVFDVFNKGFARSRAQGMGFFSSLKRGMGGVTKAFKFGALSIKGIIGGLAVSLGPILAILAAVVAAIWVLKKMWETNFLGMQTTFSKVMGEIKSAWGKFQAGFVKFLKAIEPLMKIVLTPIIVVFKYLWTLTKGIFILLKEAFKPVIKIFKEIGQMFKGIQGDGNTLKKILNGILFVFRVIGKVAGYILKAIFTPIKWVFQGVAFIINGIKKAWEKLTNSKPFKILKAIIDGIKRVFEFLFGGDDEKAESQSAASNSYTNNKVDNRNQQIIFNTNRATSPEQTQQFGNILAKQLQQ